MTVESPYASLLAETTPRDSSIEVLGSTTRFWEYGPADAPETVVVVHGYRGEHHGIEPVIAHLRNLRIISPDLPGFGESDALRDRAHDIAGYAAWLSAFVAALALPRAPVILGHSFGSIVVSAAVASGLDVSRVVLINPIAAPALEGPNGFMSVFLAQSKDPALRRWIHDQHHTYFSRYATRDSVVEGFEASIASDVSMVASGIPQPTLLIGADRDPITSVDAQEHLATLFPDARLVILAGVGHLVHYEKPAEAARAIVDFLGVGSVAQAPS